MEWPPQSPGLNNTETVWDYLDASMVAQLLANFCLTAREHWFQTCKGTCSMEFDCFLHAHTQVPCSQKSMQGDCCSWPWPCLAKQICNLKRPI